MAVVVGSIAHDRQKNYLSHFLCGAVLIPNTGRVEGGVGGGSESEGGGGGRRESKRVNERAGE